MLWEGLAYGRFGLVGGEWREWRLPLLSCETILHQLRRGQVRYEELLGRRPEVFGRRRFGLIPILPHPLHRLGFIGAMHASFEEGQFPEGAQVKALGRAGGDRDRTAMGRPPLSAISLACYQNGRVDGPRPCRDDLAGSLARRRLTVARRFACIAVRELARQTCSSGSIFPRHGPRQPSGSLASSPINTARRISKKRSCGAGPIRFPASALVATVRRGRSDPSRRRADPTGGRQDARALYFSPQGDALC